MTPKEHIGRRLILVNSASSVFARGLNISVLIWLQQYLLRRISPEEYSIYPVLMSVMVVVPLFSNFLTSGLSRYLVDAYAKGDEKRIKEIVSTMFPLLLGAGVLLFSLGALFVWKIDRVLTIAPDYLFDARVMMMLLIASAAIRLPLAPFGTGLYIRQKFVILNLINVGGELFRIALLFAFLFGYGPRVLWVVVAMVAANLSVLGVLQYVSMRMVPALRFEWRRRRWSIASALTGFGAWNLLIEVSSFIQRGSDSIILNKLSSAVDVTCFYLGFMVENHMRATITVALAPIQPAVTTLHAVGDQRRLAEAYIRGGRYALWASLSVITPIVIFRHELVKLYVGSTYQATATVLLFLLAIYPLHYGNVMASKLAHAAARLRSWGLRLFAMQLCNVALTLYLVGVHKMGAVGCAMSSFVVSAIGIPLLLWPLGMKLSGVRFPRWLRSTIKPGFVPACVAAMVWIGLQVGVAPDDWVSLGICGAIGGVCYLGVLLGLCLEADEKEAMASGWRQIVAFAGLGSRP